MDDSWEGVLLKSMLASAKGQDAKFAAFALEECVQLTAWQSIAALVADRVRDTLGHCVQVS